MMKIKEKKIYQLAEGDILAEQVVTSLGGTLFKKGYELKNRDIDFIRAFLIEQAKVVLTDNNKTIHEKDPQKKEKQIEDEVVEVIKTPIEKKYNQLVKRTVKLFFDLQGGAITLPIFEIRSYLLPFIQEALQEPNLLINILKWSDQNQYISHHAVATSYITTYLAQKAGFPEKELPQISLAGYLHNIGQIKIDDRILNKKSGLTQDEFKEIQRHPTYGYEILKITSGIVEGVILSALQHHEREDGSGYPLGGRSGPIHPYAKMVSIADVYYAMCSERSYKKSLSPFLVLEQLKSDSYGKLDPKYVYIFVDLITSFIKIGSRIMLNNGYVGEVVYIDKNFPTKPVINCHGEVINLRQQTNLHIEQVEIV